MSGTSVDITAGMPRQISFEELMPIPHVERKSTRKRISKSMSTGIVNSAENISIVDQESEASSKKSRVGLRATNGKKSKKTLKKKTVNEISQSMLPGDRQTAGGKGKSIVAKTPKLTVTKNVSISNDDRVLDKNNYCAHCNGYYFDDQSDDEDWMNCIKCKRWFHDSCAGCFVTTTTNSVCRECRQVK